MSERKATKKGGKVENSGDEDGDGRCWRAAGRSAGGGNLEARALLGKPENGKQLTLIS